eukprot:g279.t1
MVRQISHTVDAIAALSDNFSDLTWEKEAVGLAKMFGGASSPALGNELVYLQKGQPFVHENKIGSRRVEIALRKSAPVSAWRKPWNRPQTETGEQPKCEDARYAGEHTKKGTCGAATSGKNKLAGWCSNVCGNPKQQAATWDEWTKDVSWKGECDACDGDLGTRGACCLFGDANAPPECNLRGIHWPQRDGKTNAPLQYPQCVLLPGRKSPRTQDDTEHKRQAWTPQRREDYARHAGATEFLNPDTTAACLGVRGAHLLTKSEELLNFLRFQLFKAFVEVPMRGEFEELKKIANETEPRKYLLEQGLARARASAERRKMKARAARAAHDDADEDSVAAAEREEERAFIAPSIDANMLEELMRLAFGNVELEPWFARGGGPGANQDLRDPTHLQTGRSRYVRARAGGASAGATSTGEDTTPAYEDEEDAASIEEQVAGVLLPVRALTDAELNAQSLLLDVDKDESVLVGAGGEAPPAAPPAVAAVNPAPSQEQREAPTLSLSHRFSVDNGSLSDREAIFGHHYRFVMEQIITVLSSKASNNDEQGPASTASRPFGSEEDKRLFRTKVAVRSLPLFGVGVAANTTGQEVDAEQSARAPHDPRGGTTSRLDPTADDTPDPAADDPPPRDERGAEADEVARLAHSSDLKIDIENWRDDVFRNMVMPGLQLSGELRSERVTDQLLFHVLEQFRKLNFFAMDQKQKGAGARGGNRRYDFNARFLYRVLGVLLERVVAGDAVLSRQQFQALTDSSSGQRYEILASHVFLERDHTGLEDLLVAGTSWGPVPIAVPVPANGNQKMPAILQNAAPQARRSLTPRLRHAFLFEDRKPHGTGWHQEILASVDLAVAGARDGHERRGSHADGAPAGREDEEEEAGQGGEIGTGTAGRGDAHSRVTTGEGRDIDDDDGVPRDWSTFLEQEIQSGENGRGDSADTVRMLLLREFSNLYYSRTDFPRGKLREFVVPSKLWPFGFSYVNEFRRMRRIAADEFSQLESTGTQEPGSSAAGEQQEQALPPADSGRKFRVTDADAERLERKFLAIDRENAAAERKLEVTLLRLRRRLLFLQRTAASEGVGQAREANHAASGQRPLRLGGDATRDWLFDLFHAYHRFFSPYEAEDRLQTLKEGTGHDKLAGKRAGETGIDEDVLSVAYDAYKKLQDESIKMEEEHADDHSEIPAAKQEAAQAAPIGYTNFRSEMAILVGAAAEEYEAKKAKIQARKEDDIDESVEVVSRLDARTDVFRNFLIQVDRSSPTVLETNKELRLDEARRSMGAKLAAKKPPQVEIRIERMGGTDAGGRQGNMPQQTRSLTEWVAYARLRCRANEIQSAATVQNSRTKYLRALAHSVGAKLTDDRFSIESGMFEFKVSLRFRGTKAAGADADAKASSSAWRAVSFQRRANAGKAASTLDTMLTFDEWGACRLGESCGPQCRNGGGLFTFWKGSKVVAVYQSPSTTGRRAHADEEGQDVGGLFCAPDTFGIQTAGEFFRSTGAVEVSFQDGELQREKKERQAKNVKALQPYYCTCHPSLQLRARSLHHRPYSAEENRVRGEFLKAAGALLNVLAVRPATVAALEWMQEQKQVPLVRHQNGTMLDEDDSESFLEYYVKRFKSEFMDGGGPGGNPLGVGGGGVLLDHFFTATYVLARARFSPPADPEPLVQLATT